MPFFTKSSHEFFKRGLDVKRGSLLLKTQAHDRGAVARGRDPQDGTRAARVAAHTVKIDLKHFKSWRIRYAYVCRSVQMRRLQGWRKDGLHVHLPERPDDPRSSGNEGVQPGTRRLLGMLFLREDLPPGRHHRSSLRRLCSHGRHLYPHALCRLHHVDRAVPQRQRETLQVPHPHHS